MNQIIQFGKQQQPLMSSREIAQLCEKRHDHVLRDIENLNATYAEMAFPKIGESKYISQLNGIEYREYLLTREQCIDLITGYRADVRIRINRRWVELEEQAAPSVPQTLPEALRLAADLAERNEQQAALLAETRPKAQALERISHADGDLCITDAAKLLKLRPKDLFGLLSMRRWIYKRDGRGSWIGYQDKVQQGLKPPDFMGAYACSACHDEIDRRTRHLDAETVRLAFAEGVMRTQQILADKGLLEAA